MIVELCGIPGAGKSFVAHTMAGDLRAAGQPVSLPLEPLSPRCRPPVRILRKLRRGFTELIVHPASSLVTIRAIMGTGQPSLRDVVRRSLNLLVLRSTLRGARLRPGIHVVDQGIISELGSLAYRGDAGSALEASGPGAARLAPDLIVMIDVDPHLANERLARRPGSESRIEKAGPRRLDLLVRQQDLLEDVLVDWMQRFGQVLPTALIRLDNDHHDGAPDLAALMTAVADGPCFSKVTAP